MLAEIHLKRYVNPSAGIAPGYGIIYFLFLENSVVYVGQTKQDLFGRLSQHVRDKVFDSYSVMPVSMADLNRIERHYISKYKPRYNVVHNPRSADF